MTSPGARAYPRLALTALLVAALVAWDAFASDTVPTDIEQPGTQPLEVGAFATNCDTCHFSSNPPADEQFLPAHGWNGSMMSHAMRDPIFWATVAVAEQDFLPNADPAQRGGAGDLCLRCHGPNGWLGGRSTPTNGSAFTGNDERGVECEFCHLLVDPDEPLNIPSTVEEQTAPYLAFDDETGVGNYGSGQYVMNSDGTRLGPYANAVANHAFLPSSFHRDGRLCATCHDVSNPAVGDLAWNHGAQVPLAPGSFSGVPGAPVDGKAAFNNPPYAYGIVERTSSEWSASGVDTLRVNDIETLPDELKVAGGAFDVAYQAALQNDGSADYVDGTPRVYSCQTCHMPARTGKGCNKNGSPVRTDLPWHDMTGSAYWMPDAIVWQADHGTLRFGSLSSTQRSALVAGQDRARAMLESAARLELSAAGETLVVRVANLTGHKLISGYPEGRRMWLNLRWLDVTGQLLEEDGAYGTLERPAFPTSVETLLDPEDTVIYQAKPGLDERWAQQLVDLGYDQALPLEYDRVTDAVDMTLGQLASAAPGSAEGSFRFVLNNVLVADNRIPPYGMTWDAAAPRNVLPVPDRQYGGRGPGGVFNHAAVEAFKIPDDAVSVEVRLFYQQTSWEYIQFLWLANDGLDPFLGQEGDNMLDAWLNTGMASPLLLTQATLSLDALDAAPGETSSPSDGAPLVVDWDASQGEVVVTYEPGCGSTGQTIYFGDLADVAGYVYRGAVCAVDNSGGAAFDPGPGDVFFLVVGNNGIVEGSYGTDGAAVERPEDSGTPACDTPQDLEASCDGGGLPRVASR